MGNFNFFGMFVSVFFFFLSFKRNLWFKNEYVEVLFE